MHTRHDLREIKTSLINDSQEEALSRQPSLDSRLRRINLPPEILRTLWPCSWLYGISAIGVDLDL